MIDTAVAGSTLLVPPCVYRESVTVNKPLTIDGQNKAEIRGSDVWTAWNQSGNTWTSQQAVPNLPYVNDPSRCADGTDGCLHPEQVFLDGQPVKFTLDASRHIVITNNPAGHTLEVTTRPNWLRTTADNVTIKNLTMRHAGNDAQQAAISNWGGPTADAWHSGFVLDHDQFLYAHGSTAGICCAGQTGGQLTNSEIAYAGQLGFGVYQAPNVLISGNHFHDNNVAHFNCYWECGAMKLVSMPNVQVLNNEVDHSDTGVWTDIGATGGLIQGNNVHDNTSAGIYVEISTGVRVTGNTVTNNGTTQWNGGGIASATSNGIEIDHNVLSGNGSSGLGWGITAFFQSRPDAPPGAGTGNYVHDNQISMPGTPTAYALTWWDDSGTNVVCGPNANNRGVNNTYQYPAPEAGEWRFQWCNQQFAHLADFQQTPGGQGGGYIIVPAPTTTAIPTLVPTATLTPVPTAARVTQCQVEIWINGQSQGKKKC